MGKVLSKNDKEIVALSSFEALRLRPGMYVGQIAMLEEKIPLIKDNKLISSEKSWSPGFTHLLIEILENALDEAKRCKGKMKNICVEVNVDTNEISVTDEGGGFHNASKKHSKTKKNVVRTALEELHAGSNFHETDANILGTHGLGSAVVNILSKKFKVETINRTHYVMFEWNDFKVVKEEIRKKNPDEKMGTKISFIPTPELFPNYVWDLEQITTYLSFKSFLIKKDPIINKLQFNCSYINKGIKSEIIISENFIPQEHIAVHTSLGSIYLWQGYENSCSLSFVNGSQCTGIQQKIVNDWCNEYFKYNLAHHFYETMIVLNVPSKLMRFADQNKSKYAIGRNEIEQQLQDAFYTKFIRLLSKSDIARNIEKSIEERMYNENITKIKKAQKQSKRKISDKFTPSSKYKGNILISEGLSAAGGAKQSRDPETDAIYALKGKVKNVKRLSDLSNNVEWLDIMSILEIEPGTDKMPAYDKIIIASDDDCIDENHFIITESGNKQIKDITYSDKILSHSGEYKDVEKIIKTEKDSYIEIEVNGKIFECSENHTLIVFRKGEIKEIFAKDLKKTDFLLLKR